MRTQFRAKASEPVPARFVEKSSHTEGWEADSDDGDSDFDHGEQHNKGDHADGICRRKAEDTVVGVVDFGVRMSFGDDKAEDASDDRAR